MAMAAAATAAAAPSLSSSRAAAAAAAASTRSGGRVVAAAVVVVTQRRRLPGAGRPLIVAAGHQRRRCSVVLAAAGAGGGGGDDDDDVATSVCVSDRVSVSVSSSSRTSISTSTARQDEDIDGAGGAPTAAPPPPRRAIVARRAPADGPAAAPHQPIGLVLFGSWALGSAASIAGLPGPLWMPALAGATVGGVFAAAHRYASERLWRPPAAPLNVVVTGGTRGLGKALAREFLLSGDAVLITGRDEASLGAAMAALRSEVAALGLPPLPGGAPPRLHGAVCDVSDAAQVAALGAAARAALGGVDAWVCNAGASGGYRRLLDAEEGALEAVVRTNLLGALLCARAAARLMLRQPLGGHVFLMDGAGADGHATPQYAAYGATKAALPQLAATLRAELAATHVGVHCLSPGMMVTDLLLEGATPAGKAAFNILCEHPETVAAFLVPRVRSAVSCGLTGTYARYLTPASAVWRLLTAPARVGRFFDGAGRPTYAPEEERILGRGAKRTARQAAAARARTSGLGLAYSFSLALCFAALALGDPSVLHASAAAVTTTVGGGQ